MLWNSVIVKFQGNCRISDRAENPEYSKLRKKNLDVNQQNVGLYTVISVQTPS